MESAGLNQKSVVLTYDPNDKRAVGLFEWLRMVDFLKIEDSPYDPQYVAEVKSMNENDFQQIDLADLWK